MRGIKRNVRVSLLSLAVLATGAQGAVTLQDVQKETVLLWAKAAPTTVTQGTGFFVARQTGPSSGSLYLVTCRHLLRRPLAATKVMLKREG